MKKNIVFTLLFATLCLPISADIITPSQALTIAEDFLGETLSPNHVRGMRGATNVKEEEPAPLYIISRGEDLGWVIVSGDDCLPTVIGYTDAGNFDPNDMSPAYRDLLDVVTAAVTDAQKTGVGSRILPATATNRENISPLLTSHWNQGAPWNLRCPLCPDNGEHAVTGCVATAASQVVYYFRKDLPGTIQASTPTYKGDEGKADVTEVIKKGTPIQYELMLDSYSNNEPEEFKMAVATLCYAVGAAAKLQYGHSTGGYITEANKIMKSHFGLGGSPMDRGNMALNEWEDVIYGSLEKAKPLIFSGFKEGGGGHAINIDGYDAKKGLWHFNFGWGGSGDGYYTLDLETGVNGFCQGQSIIYNITPTKQSMSGELQCGDILYRRVYNTVKACITNNSNVAIKGFSIFLMTSDKNPNSSSTALANENETWIAPGETAVITFKVRPSLVRDYYIYLTDAQRNTIDHCKVTVVENEPDLSLNGLDISASNDIVTESGFDFRILHNTTATLYADISNSANGTPGQPSVKFELYKWNRVTGKDTLSVHKTVSSIVFEKGERITMSNTFKNLADDTYYIGRISCDDIKIECPDSIVRFYVANKSSGNATLAINDVTDGVATLSGGWDPIVFAQLATDPSICTYDLTAVSGVTPNVSEATAANPNALFYVTGDLKGRNIVNNGQCAALSLINGYDFHPMAPFHAESAEFIANLTPAVWNTLTLPFACQRPAGWLCREVTAFSASYIADAIIADKLLPSHAYLVMSDNRNALPFTATDVEVAAAVDTTQMTPFIGTYQTIKATPLLHEGDTYILSLDTDPATTTPYFNKVDTTYMLPPFQTVISSESKKIRATVNNTLESAYRKLATAIDEAQSLYDEMHTQITDSANLAMETVLAEARKTFFQMSEETTGNVSALTKQLNTTIESYPLMLKRITRPIDYTVLLTNPSFETNNKTGWKSDAYATVKPLTNISTYGAFADGKYLLYNNKANASTAIYQTATGLPDGYYRASAMLGTVEGGIVTFYANDTEVEVPASEYGKYYLSEAIIDSIRVEDGEITIGIRAGKTWYKADDFKLYYIGHLYNDDITAIEEIKKDKMQPIVNDNAIYDMIGRRLANPNDMLPGILYIQGGRKIMRVE